MYKYSASDIMDEKNITKIITRFKSNETPRFEKLEKYFNLENEILNRVAKDGKPNNKLAHGFAKYITRMATGYFMGKPVRYIIPDDEKESTDNEDYRQLLNKVLDNNYTASTNFEMVKEASKKGIAFELLYIDEKSKLHACKLGAEEIIPIYSPNIGEFLEAAIRLWVQTDIDGNATEYAALYTETEIITYSKAKGRETYELINIENHGFTDIPVIVYWNNEEQKGDYEDTISLIDAYDRAQSDTANDSEYFADAYLVIAGALGGIDDGSGNDDPDAGFKSARRNRMLMVDEKGQVSFLTKNINDTALENYKNRLYHDIFFISQVPPLSDESFSSNLSGVAIRYKLIGIEELTTEKEHKFLSAQKKKIRIITDFINSLHNKKYNPDLVEIKTQRNFIDNLSESIEQAKALTGIVSQETQLGLLPIVEDVAEEMEKLKPDNGDDDRPFYSQLKQNRI